MLKKISTERLNELSNQVRILMYQKNPNLLTEIDLDNNNIFLEPLLLSYFNQEKTNKDMLLELMIGFRNVKDIQISTLYNKENIAYLPNLGYFKKGRDKIFSELFFIKNSNIEIVKYDVPLFRNIIHSISLVNPIEDKELLMHHSLFRDNVSFLDTAFHYYNEYVSDYFSLLSIGLKKCVFFKVKNKVGKSFCSIKAHGTIFFNIYDNKKHQQNETYFIDNLGVCMGKIFFTSIFHNLKKVFTITYNTKIFNIIPIKEDRNIYTLFLNFFTEANGAFCLNEILEKAPLSIEQKKEIELRLILHLKKSTSDKKVIEELIRHYSKKENLFNSDAELMYDLAISHHDKVYKKFENILSKYDNMNITPKTKFIEFIHELNN